jgi:aryl sulfotransferase
VPIGAMLRMHPTDDRISAPQTYRTWLMDSRRWEAYRPRKNDIVITTYPKSGTTWVQRIVSLLIFQTSDIINLDRICPWWERRTGAPIEEIVLDFEAQLHQRSIKTHLPLDGLTIYDQTKYIHVVRDGRDVALSYHNHCRSHTRESIKHLNKIGMEDDTLLRPYPEIPKDSADFFHKWLTTPAIDGQSEGSPFLSYFNYEKTYAQALGKDNFLFIHYDDLQANLLNEMEKIADFINVSISKNVLSMLAKSATFKEMQHYGDDLIPITTKNFTNGALGFFNAGKSGRWKGLFSKEDLRLFDEKLLVLPEHYRKWALSETHSRGSNS